MGRYPPVYFMVLIIGVASSAARAVTGKSGLPTQVWFAESAADRRGDLSFRDRVNARIEREGKSSG